MRMLESPGFFFVRPCCTRSRHGDAGALRQRDVLLGGVRQSVEADEVSAVRVAPAGTAGIGETLFEHAGDQFELRANDFSMLFHVFGDALCILEETDVSELVDFVVSDGLDAHPLLDLRYVFFARGNGGSAPGNVTFEVLANLKYLFGLPAFSHASAMSATWAWRVS